jgi:hypothetical protein
MNTPNPQHDSGLVIFSGLVTEVNPADLPPGAAAICTDMDFTLGSTFSRDGIESVYVYEGSDQTAPAGLGIDVVISGNQVWSNPDNIIHDTMGTYASVVLSATPVSFSTNNISQNNSVLNPPFGGPLQNSITVATDNINAGDTGVLQLNLSDPYGGGSFAGVTAVAVDSFGNTWLPIGGPIHLTTSNFFQIFYFKFTAQITIGTTFTITTTFSNPSANIGINYAGFVNVVGAGVLNPSIVTNSGASDGTTGDFSIGTITLPGAAIVVATAYSQLSLSGFPPGLAYVGWGNSGGDNSQGYMGEISGATYTDSWTTVPSADFAGTLFSFAAASVAAPADSDILRANTYGFSIPLSSQVLGIEVQITGKQSAPTAELTIAPFGGGTINTWSFIGTDSTVTFGGPGELFGRDFAPSDINNPGFGFDIRAFGMGTGGTTVDISGVNITVWYTPEGIENFNYIKTFAMTNTALFALAVDNTGILWNEDVLGNPGVLVPIYTAILPDTFAQSATYDDREWIAFSDNQHATDIPRQYNGQWVDRVSQVGPGAGCQFSPNANSYNVESITQAGTVKVRGAQWGGAPNSRTPGNVVSVFDSDPAFTANLTIGQGVKLELSAVDSRTGLNFNMADGTYVITAIGTAKGMESGGTELFYYFSVVATQSFQLVAFDSSPGGIGTYQLTLATLTTETALPNVQVGSQIALAGVTPSQWNNTWTILYTPNAAQLNITDTSLSGNVATYDYALITGTAPVVGQQVTVIGTTNGDGIFNIVNGIISSVGVNTFSLVLSGADVLPAAETGSAVVNGTMFQFDPGISLAGTMTDPIFGTGTGGTVTQPGNLGAGVRQGVVIFQTRNDAITFCSSPVTFTLNEGANSITCSQVPIGPPNVTKRIIAFTGAGGDFFYYIPQPVIVTSLGQQITYDATVINDNIATSATFTFTDGVLLSSIEIDIQGNNLFETIELGSCMGFVPFANRMFAIGEQNKVQNFINLSFDGGYLNVPGNPNQPLGWTTTDLLGSLIVSPIFGNSYEIVNSTGSTISGPCGMISQTAFQDFFKTPIITPNTQYGVRVCAWAPNGDTVGNLVIDLFSPGFNIVYGSFSIPLASMSEIPAIFTGNLLLTEFFSAVPADTVYRIYCTGLTAGEAVIIDRTEPFDLSQPVLTTQLRASYFGNFEAFDGVTGNLGTAITNQQPVNNAFTLYENLYIVRSASLASTFDNGITEPSQWNVKEVSNKCGTTSIHGVDVGEGWAVIAGQPGLYIFDGGQPVKISPEIDSLWAAINWTFGFNLWVRNDTTNRRVSIGVPMPMPNKWCPDFPANATPTQPNVVITMQYKELMTSGAVAGEGPIRQSYTGALKTYALGRKWSVWSIEAAYADFIARPTTAPDSQGVLFYCGDTDTAKIYEQVVGNHFDDGGEIFDEYVTYPFLKSEDAQAQQAGLHNLQAVFASALIRGEGEYSLTVYSDFIDSDHQQAYEPPYAMADPPPWGDTEMPINESGTRFFLGFKTKTPGDWFELSRVVMNVTMDPWAPIRGSNE